MTDLRALTDAFAELERRADAAAEGAPRPASRPAMRLMPVAATAVAVAALVAGAALFLPGDQPPSGLTAPADTRPSTVASPPPSGSDTPTTPDELIARLRTVLAGTATFTVVEEAPGAAVVTVPPAPGSEATEPEDSEIRRTVGAFITGTLTAQDTTGGFDLTINPVARTSEPNCDGFTPPECTLRQLADGAWLRTRSMPLEGPPNGITHEAYLLRADGVEISMHVSNQRSPKGASELLAPHPPLTLDQVVEIVTSEHW